MSTQNLARRSRLLMVVAVAAVALLATACPDDEDAEPAEPFAAEPELGVGAEGDTLDQELEGQELAVTGTVIRIASPHSFMLDETDLEDGRPVLVITHGQDVGFALYEDEAEEGQTVLNVGDRVRAGGEAHRLFADTFQQRYGISYDETIFGFHQGGLAIDARDLEVVERAAEDEPRPQPTDES